MALAILERLIVVVQGAVAVVLEHRLMELLELLIKDTLVVKAL
jgi:hypothetical protein